MSIKSFAAKVFAYIIRQKTLQWSSRPYRTQDKVFEELINKVMQLFLVKIMILNLLKTIQILLIEFQSGIMKN